MTLKRYLTVKREGAVKTQRQIWKHNDAELLVRRPDRGNNRYTEIKPSVYRHTPRQGVPPEFLLPHLNPFKGHRGPIKIQRNKIVLQEKSDAVWCRNLSGGRALQSERGLIGRPATPTI